MNIFLSISHYFLTYNNINRDIKVPAPVPITSDEETEETANID
jgi:hypothetical protein